MTKTEQIIANTNRSLILAKEGALQERERIVLSHLVDVLLTPASKPKPAPKPKATPQEVDAANAETQPIDPIPPKKAKKKTSKR